MPRVVAVVLAAGRGERFGGDKISLPLRGKPVWRWSFETFLRHPRVDAVGLVVRPDAVDAFRELAPEAAFVVAGGGTRTESSHRGVQAADPADIVLVHDGARPFLTATVIDAVLDGIEAHGAAAPALPLTDTVKELGDSGVRTLDRNRLRTVQTPQGARRADLLRAFARGEQGTDELSLLEAIGIVPALVQGDPENRKITHPEDMTPAPEFRTGIGYDIHAFSSDPTRPLWLGGVEFEGHRGLDGHSDADVLSHAIADALLGAVGLGDIGQHFPNTDPAWKDRRSTHLLAGAKALLQERGWRIVNIDATLIAETPKLGGRREPMRQVIAATLNLDPECVSVKATTNEHLGAVGRGEGIAAFAVATVRSGS